MWSESEIQNFKKIFLDEVSCYGHDDEAEKVFDKTLERVRNLDFSEFQDKEAIEKLFETVVISAEDVASFKETLESVRNLNFSKFQTKEAIDKLIETLEMHTKFVAFFKDSLVNNKFDTSPEECFRNGVRVGKEFFRIKEKQH